MERYNEKGHEVEPLLTQISNRATFTNTPYQIPTNQTFRQFYTQKLPLKPYTAVLKTIVDR